MKVYYVQCLRGPLDGDIIHVREDQLTYPAGGGAYVATDVPTEWRWYSDDELNGAK